MDLLISRHALIYFMGFGISPLCSYDIWFDNPTNFEWPGVIYDRNWKRECFQFHGYRLFAEYDEKRCINIRREHRRGPLCVTEDGFFTPTQDYVVFSQDGRDFMRLKDDYIVGYANSRAYVFDYLCGWFKSDGEIQSFSEIEKRFPRKIDDDSYVLK